MSLQRSDKDRLVRCTVACIAWALWACGATSDLDRGERPDGGSIAPIFDAGDMDSARSDASSNDANGLDVTVIAPDATDDGSHPLDAGVDTGVFDAGALVRERVALTSSDVGDHFGSVVALTDDTLVVGVPGEDSAATGVNGDSSNQDAVDSGAAYVFTHRVDEWFFHSYLKASNTDDGDLFGAAVAISGDTVVVGAPYEDSTSPTRAIGAAYVFVRRGGNWSQQALLKSDSSGSFGGFGGSVAISGDTIVVGASDPGLSGNGAAYVFTRSGEQWTQSAVLVATSPDAYDYFGSSVAIERDTIAIGAPGEASSATGVDGDATLNDEMWAGAAYVFERRSGGWTQTAYLKTRFGSGRCFRCDSARDTFGASVSVQGDRVLVGAPNEDSNAVGINGSNYNGDPVGHGAAYLFVKREGRWVDDSQLRPSAPSEYTSYGASVAISGGSIVVGSSDTGALDLAHAYVQPLGPWVERPLLQGEMIGPYDDSHFGASVAIGGGWIAVGARGENEERGAVYLFH